MNRHSHDEGLFIEKLELLLRTILNTMVLIQKITLLVFSLIVLISCGENGIPTEKTIVMGEGNNNDLEEGVDYFLPKIDLSHWKVTLPIGNPSEVKPPAILDYATDQRLQEFMYNDSTDGSLVFYTYPGSTTPNSSYSRTELREQMVPGSNTTNWTFKQGGIMKGTLAMAEISKDASDKFHRAIVMQIHGRLTDEQRDLISEDDNNAPPVLKIYWVDGKVRVHRKVLKNLQDAEQDILHTSAWKDEAKSFETAVNHEKFTLKIEAAEGFLKVTLNENESMLFDDEHIQRWGVFENYFKAGNYLISRDEGAFSRVKYYSLEVSH